MSERLRTNIEIKGAKQTIAALAAFEPELYKQMNAQIRKSLLPVKAQAQSNYPNGAWVTRLNKKSILGSIIARGGGTRGRSWEESDGGIRAAVFEFAGSVQSGRTPQARAMIESLNRRYGQPGRFLWAAWDSQGKKVLNDIRNSVLRAERDLQARLDATGEEF